MYIYICYPPPPKIDHFLRFEKDAVHYCKKQMCICWGRHSSAVLLRTVAKLRTCQGCNTARLCKTAAPGNLKFQNFKSFQDTAQAKLPNYRPGKASLLNCRHCRPWLQNRLGRASAPTLQGFAKLQPLPTCQSTAQAKVPNYGCKIANLQGSNTAGPAPTLQNFPSKSAKLQGPGKVAKLQTCKGSNTAGLQNYSTCCKACQTTKKAATSKLQGSNTAGTPNCKAFQACQAVC